MNAEATLEQASSLEALDSTENSKDKCEEKEETSSNGSSSGKSGSGSGGYNADCSASDQSSDENGNRKDYANSSQNDSAQNSGVTTSAAALGTVRTGRSKGKRSSKGGNVGLLDIENFLSQTKAEDEGDKLFDGSSVLPQLNGVRISHPMDPRIDLSRVGVTSSASVPTPAPLQRNMAKEVSGLHPNFGAGFSAPVPTAESYMQLLQVSHAKLAAGVFVASAYLLF